MSAGKGDKPRNLGALFHKNYKQIKGFGKRKAVHTKGRPVKWKKVY